MNTPGRERSVIFTGPEVRAVQDGRKTQFRRVVKAGRDPNFGCELAPCEIAAEINRVDPNYELCPFGQPGTVLWVRETWGWSAKLPYGIHDECLRASHPDLFAYRIDEPTGSWCWRPSSQMPRWASRLTLRVTDVRVQRLQEISEKDARAEGCDPYIAGEGVVKPPMFGDEYQYRPDYRTGFQILWDTTHGKRHPWASNPWVWATTFERIPAGAP